jgi:AcrR family transcriptional regulator
MSMAGKCRDKGGTKEKIVDVAIQLFTEQGIANVSTNHIASAMGISPGNLYYHFRNKEDILWHALGRFSSAMALLMGSPDEEEVDALRLRQYLEDAIGVLNDYRFFMENEVGLVRESERVETAFRELEQENVGKLVQIFGALQSRGIMIGPTGREEVEALASNIWIVFTNWLNYLRTSRGGAGVSIEDRRSGMFHVFMLFRPYLTEEAITEVGTLFRRGDSA